MALAASIVDVDSSRRRTTRHLNLTFSGNYTTGGETLNLSAVTNPNHLPAALAFGALPTVTVIENLPDGYTAEIVPGTALNTYKWKWYTAAGTELTAAAYPAAISGAADVAAALVSKTNL